MVEQFWYAVPETCLMFTAFREDLNPSFVAIVTFLFVIKAFHWLAEDRIDFVSTSLIIMLSDTDDDIFIRWREVRLLH